MEMFACGVDDTALLRFLYAVVSVLGVFAVKLVSKQGRGDAMSWITR